MQSPGLVTHTHMGIWDMNMGIWDMECGIWWTETPSRCQGQPCTDMTCCGEVRASPMSLPNGPQTPLFGFAFSWSRDGAAPLHSLTADCAARALAHKLNPAQMQEFAFVPW